MILFTSPELEYFNHNLAILARAEHIVRGIRSEKAASTTRPRTASIVPVLVWTLLHHTAK
jgi:hypothetical protein